MKCNNGSVGKRMLNGFRTVGNFIGKSQQLPIQMRTVFICIFRVNRPFDMGGHSSIVALYFI
jgi:hypothetical protein